MIKIQLKVKNETQCIHRRKRFMWITDNRKKKEEDIYHEINTGWNQRSSGMGKAGIKLPGYDVEAVSKKAKEAPGWVHFGIGNIFRVFIGGIADGLLEEGVLDRGITCVETFDYDVIDKIYKPYDNLSLSVILHGDGTREYKVMGALARR